MLRPPASRSRPAPSRRRAGFGSGSLDSEGEEEHDPFSVFDQPEAEPDRLFVNPFAVYNISPLQVGHARARASVRTPTRGSRSSSRRVLAACRAPARSSPGRLHLQARGRLAKLWPQPHNPPSQWEELQAAGRAAEAAGRDPWYALQQQGVQCSEGAFVYLSPAQLAMLEEELAAACAAMDTTRLEAASFFVSDCLMRARLANSRMPAAAERWS